MFDFDKSDIKPDSFALVDEVAAVLSKNPDLEVAFEGHTDGMGPEEYNQKLSERRAAAVMQYMLDKGIQGNQMTAMGYGKSRPVSSNDTEEARALNRRVEITPKE